MTDKQFGANLRGELKRAYPGVKGLRFLELLRAAYIGARCEASRLISERIASAVDQKMRQER